ncbi:hypothetical protein WJX77_003879 [Trebouxia sp. C0004]
MHTHLSLPLSCKVAGPSGLHDKQWSILFCKRRARGLRTKSSNNGASEGVPKRPDNVLPKADEQWQDLAFPTYLQSEVDDFCQDWDEALQLEERRQSDASHRDVTKKSRRAVTQDNPVWQAIRKEAAKDAAQEPILSSFLYASVLSHDSFEMALAAILANRLSDPTMMATELIDIFHSVLRGCQEVEQAALADVIAVRERDPACTAYSSALLYYKGYHALQTHRIAHGLWQRGQKVLARSLQYRCTQTLAVDIHTAATIGKGVLLDHGTGLVIGETAVVGNNVSILHNVTLGGTGKEVGDRHPKVSDNVLIGANATILGNITIGKGAQVAAGSLVLKDVPPRTMVAGSPAKEVGKVTGNPALKMQHWMKNQLVKESYAEKWEDIVRSGNTQSPPQGSESKTRLPAEFGTKDKVPADGTAPMGLSDYADGSQWTQRGGKLERQESGQAPDSISQSNSNSSLDSTGKTASAKDGGFVGGDGASLNGAARSNNSSASNQTPNGVTSAESTHVSRQQQTDVQGHLQNQPQGSGQLPSQAPTQSSSEHNGAAPPAAAGRLSSGSNGASSSGSNSGVAPSDSDWWRELTEASKRSDCKDTASALNPKQDQHKASSRQVDGSPAKTQAEQDIFGGKGYDPDSQSNSSRQNGASSSSSSKPASRSSPSFSDSSSSKGLSMQTPQASAKSSTAVPRSQQEAAEMKKKAQEVKELADKIEGQEAGTGQQAQMASEGKQPPQQQPEASDFEYWI